MMIAYWPLLYQVLLLALLVSPNVVETELKIHEYIPNPNKLIDETRKKVEIFEYYTEKTLELGELAILRLRRHFYFLYLMFNVLVLYGTRLWVLSTSLKEDSHLPCHSLEYNALSELFWADLDGKLRLATETKGLQRNFSITVRHESDGVSIYIDALHAELGEVPEPWIKPVKAIVQALLGMQTKISETIALKFEIFVAEATGTRARNTKESQYLFKTVPEHCYFNFWEQWGAALAAMTAEYRAYVSLFLLALHVEMHVYGTRSVDQEGLLNVLRPITILSSLSVPPPVVGGPGEGLPLIANFTYPMHKKPNAALMVFKYPVARPADLPKARAMIHFFADLCSRWPQNSMLNEAAQLRNLDVLGQEFNFDGQLGLQMVVVGRFSHNLLHDSLEPKLKTSFGLYRNNWQWYNDHILGQWRQEMNKALGSAHTWRGNKTTALELDARIHAVQGLSQEERLTMLASLFMSKDTKDGNPATRTVSMRSPEILKYIEQPRNKPIAPKRVKKTLPKCTFALIMYAFLTWQRSCVL